MTLGTIRHEQDLNTYVSMVEMKGLGLGSISVGVGRPATTGSMNQGPKLD